MSRTTGLILSGGGARAAYQVGVLDAIAQLRRTHHAGRDNPFPVICGTSSGAINAAALACGADDFDASVDGLTEVWRNFHVQQVYQADVRAMVGAGLRWLATLSLGWMMTRQSMHPRSLLNNAPLDQLLRKRIPLERLPGLLRSGHLQALAITASSYTHGEHVTFYDSRHPITPWTRTQRVAQRGPLTHAHLLASSAIPFVFPAVALSGPHGPAYFGDGAMRQLAPLAPAIHLGADRILVIGSGRLLEPPPLQAPSPAEPSLAHIAGHALNSIFLDSLSVDLERLQRINQTVALIPPELRRKTHLKPVELLLITPSERLDEIAAKHRRTLPHTVQNLLGILGARNGSSTPQGNALLSYLLFEAEFTRELMALGHADALAQREEILRFFGWGHPAESA